MKYWKISVTTVILAMALQGCVIAVNTDGMESGRTDWRETRTRNRDLINHLEMGCTRASVQAELGEPDFIDSFRRDGAQFRVLYYRTHRVHDDGRTTRDETTPLVFSRGELVGWGESAIDKAAP